jgi:hypothetical protein
MRSKTVMLWSRVTSRCFLHIVIIHMIESVTEISEKLFEHLLLFGCTGVFLKSVSLKIWNIFFLFWNNIFFMFLNYFDVLILKIIFKK